MRLSFRIEGLKREGARSYPLKTSVRDEEEITVILSSARKKKEKDGSANSTGTHGEHLEQNLFQLGRKGPIPLLTSLCQRGGGGGEVSTLWGEEKVPVAYGEFYPKTESYKEGGREKRISTSHFTW